MAVLIEGLQGSGKSYYATYRMFYDGSKYGSIYTNIDGLKPTDKIKPLEFKGFVNDVLNDVYTQQVSFDGSFDESISLFKKAGYLPDNVSSNNRVLLVIDEAQNYFGKSVKLEPSLVWFITQHRHLYFELYLITQKYTLLRSDYHLFNLVYKALPPVKQVIKSKIRYIEYAGLPLNDDNESRRFSLAKEQKVFDLYESGDKVESPNILAKFIWYFVGLGLGIFLLISYFLSTFGSAETSPEVKTERVVDTVLSSSPASASDALPSALKKKLFVFSVWTDGYFYVEDINNNQQYPIEFLTYLKDEFFLTVVSKVSDDYRTVIYAICDYRIKTFLTGNEDRKLKDFSASDIAI